MGVYIAPLCDNYLAGVGLGSGIEIENLFAIRGKEGKYTNINTF